MLIIGEKKRHDLSSLAINGVPGSGMEDASGQPNMAGPLGAMFKFDFNFDEDEGERNPSPPSNIHSFETVETSNQPFNEIPLSDLVRRTSSLEFFSILSDTNSPSFIS